MGLPPPHQTSGSWPESTAYRLTALRRSSASDRRAVSARLGPRCRGTFDRARVRQRERSTGGAAVGAAGSTGRGDDARGVWARVRATRGSRGLPLPRDVALGTAMWRSERHGIRAVVEAHARARQIEGGDEASARALSAEVDSGSAKGSATRRGLGALREAPRLCRGGSGSLTCSAVSIEEVLSVSRQAHGKIFNDGHVREIKQHEVGVRIPQSFYSEGSQEDALSAASARSASPDHRMEAGHD